MSSLLIWVLRPTISCGGGTHFSLHFSENTPSDLSQFLLPLLLEDVALPTHRGNHRGLLRPTSRPVEPPPARRLPGAVGQQGFAGVRVKEVCPLSQRDGHPKRTMACSLFFYIEFPCLAIWQESMSRCFWGIANPGLRVSESKPTNLHFRFLCSLHFPSSILSRPPITATHNPNHNTPADKFCHFGGSPLKSPFAIPTPTPPLDSTGPSRSSFSPFPPSHVGCTSRGVHHLSAAAAQRPQLGRHRTRLPRGGQRTLLASARVQLEPQSGDGWSWMELGLGADS